MFRLKCSIVARGANLLNVVECRFGKATEVGSDGGEEIMFNDGSAVSDKKAK